MPTCFNCRAAVPANSVRCPRCGVSYSPSLWQTVLSGLPPSAHGWGLPPAMAQGAVFRLIALLVPFWVPPLVALLVGGETPALALLLAPFIFIPGVHAIANFVAWPRWARFFASLGYVAVTGILGLVFLSWFIKTAGLA